MEELYLYSIAIGLLISTLFWEGYGIAVGGLIIPGYLAIYFQDIDKLLVTILAAILTYFSVDLLKNIALIYGKRRNTIMLLTGFAWGEILRTLSPMILEVTHVALDPIGYIIPGLIAISIDKQGLNLTIGAMLLSSAIVRLILLFLVQGVLN